MYLVLCLLIWNLECAMKSVPVPTANFIILSSLSLARKMLPTTMLVVTTPSAKKSSIWCLTASANSPITAPVSKDS